MNFFSILAAGLLGASQLVWAARGPVQGPSILEGPPTLQGGRYVDELIEEARKRRPQGAARKVAQAWKFLQLEKFGPAIEAAGSVRMDPLYADLGSWIFSEAILAQAQKYPASSSETKLLQAIDSYIQIEKLKPDSPILKRVPDRVAAAEIALADLATRSKAWLKSQHWFETALARLMASNSYFIQKFSFPALERYVFACKKKPNDTCKGWLRKLVATFPKESREARAMQEAFPDLAPVAGSGESYQDGNRTYKGPDLDTQAFDEAMALHLKGSWSKAAEKFLAFLDQYPLSQYRHRARYWLARSYELDREPEQARKYYEIVLATSPLTYYGLMASRALGLPIEARIDAVLPMAVAEEESLTPSEKIRLRRGQELFAHGAAELASGELDQINARREMSGAFVTYLAALNYELGNFPTSFKQVSDLLQRGNRSIISTFGLKLIFPLIHYDLVQKYAELNKLDPILVLSLMKQESAFRTNALSRSGATGLMQLMPFTAVAVDPMVEQSQLLMAENNIRIGTKYLAELLQKFDGNLVYALGSYNAGPTRMAKWKKDADVKWGMQEFIESISYSETRDYVSSIIRNYYWYTYRLTQHRLEDFGMFWKINPETKPQT